MAHTCKALFIHCMDFRFAETLFNYLKELQLLGNADVVGWAGSAHPFFQPEDMSFVMKQVRLSHKLHGITEVHIVQHMDCGAYGGSTVFSDRYNEQHVQQDQIAQARLVIQKEFPSLDVIGHFLTINDDGTTSIERVKDVATRVS